jgi:hypothetical protein
MTPHRFPSRDDVCAGPAFDVAFDVTFAPRARLWIQFGSIGSSIRVHILSRGRLVVKPIQKAAGGGRGLAGLLGDTDGHRRKSPSTVAVGGSFGRSFSGPVLARLALPVV